MRPATAETATISTEFTAAESAADAYASVDFRQQLPVAGLTASSRVALAVFNPDTGSTDGDQLWSFGLSGAQGKMRYGARYYSVGDDFAGSRVARRELDGMAAAADGQEIWAVMKAGKFTVRPQARSLRRRHGGDFSQTRLDVIRPLPGRARLKWSLSMEEDVPGHQRYLRNTRAVAMQYVQPGMQWKFTSREDATIRGNGRSERHQMALQGQLRISEGVSAVPTLRQIETWTGPHLQRVNRHAGLRLNLPELEAEMLPLELVFGVDETRADLTTARSFGISLDTGWQRQLSAQQSFSLGASLSWRQADGDTRLADGGIGIGLKFEVKGS